jgi:hypothetical protein
MDWRVRRVVSSSAGPRLSPSVRFGVRLIGMPVYID